MGDDAISIRRLVLAAALLVLPTSPAFADVAILGTILSDNGDNDGFADTHETVTLRLKLHNLGATDLNGVTLTLTSADNELACVTDSTIHLVHLPAGEIRETTQGFEFVVNDVDRTALGLGPYEDLSFGLELKTGGNSAPAIHPWRLRVDLDLDLSGGSGPTTFLESFEDGMGPFVVQNLDQGRSDLEGSDGFRCQYHDPDWVNSHNYGNPGPSEECYMASPLHADSIFWGLSGPETSPLGGRGFSGFHSLFYGIDLGPPLNWTTPVGVLEAAATDEPIHLGWDGIAPTLSIKHQASLLDERLIDLVAGLDETLDRGVVMVQVADDQDNPSDIWFKLDPYVNVHDQQGTDLFFNCMFDPIDDGSTEDTFYDPDDPERVFGPSSTCKPELVFANIGETSNPFDPANVGRAAGPGLQGIWGIGTWIESRFDLSRFRGRSVRLRFLASGLQAVSNLDWEDYGTWNPAAGDDGWWIDDVTITGVLTNRAGVAVDDNDNSGLPGPPAGADPDADAVCVAIDNCPDLSNPDQADFDNDGVGDACDSCPADPFHEDHDSDGLCGEDNCPFDYNPEQANGDGDPAGAACDCDDTDITTYPGAPEINDGIDNDCSGVADETSSQSGFHNPDEKQEYSWPAQSGAVWYQATRGNTADFSVGCTIFGPFPQTFLVDLESLASGEIRFYMNRAFAPNPGSWGQDSSGSERDIPCD